MLFLFLWFATRVLGKAVSPLSIYDIKLMFFYVCNHNHQFSSTVKHQKKERDAYWCIICNIYIKNTLETV